MRIGIYICVCVCGGEIVCVGPLFRYTVGGHPRILFESSGKEWAFAVSWFLNPDTQDLRFSYSSHD